MAFKRVLADYLGKLGEILSGDTIHPDQLGTGTRDGSKVLRDDGIWVINEGGDVNKPWSKSGKVQITNSDSVAVSDNVFQEGKVTIGADEIAMPFKTEYDLQVRGNQKIGNDTSNALDGFLSVNRLYIRDSRFGEWVRCYCDVTGGTDGLDPSAYISTTSTVGAKFLTLRQALIWAGRYQSSEIQIILENTSASTRAQMVGGNLSKNKIITISTLTTQQFIHIPTSTNIQSDDLGKISFFNMDITWVGDSRIMNGVNSLGMYFTDCNLSPDATATYFIDNSSNNAIQMDGCTFNFSANNQSVFRSAGNSGCTIIFGSHSPYNSFVTGAFTGCRMFLQDNRNCILQVMEDYTFPSTLNLSGGLIQYGKNLTIRQTTYDSNNASSGLQKHGLVVYGNEPIRTPDLNSTSSNLSYTTKKKLIVNQLGEVGVLDDTGGGSLTVAETEIDFGTTPVRAKRFTITDAGVSGTSKILVNPSGNIATGRGMDDWEWDTIQFAAKPNTGNFTLYAKASGGIGGKRKIFYTVN